MFNKSNVENLLIDYDFFLLSDKGYRNEFLIRPDSLVSKTNRGISKKRSIIENVFSNRFIGRFKVLSKKSKSSPEFHSIIIRACFELNQLLNNNKIDKK